MMNLILITSKAKVHEWFSYKSKLFMLFVRCVMTDILLPAR